MKSSFRLFARGALVSALVATASTLYAGAAAAAVPLPLNVYQGDPVLPNSQKLFAKLVPAQGIQLLRDTQTVVQTEAWLLENADGGAMCLVSSGIGSMPPEGKSPRAAYMFRSSSSVRRAKEPDSAPCERAFAESLKLLVKHGALVKKVLDEHAAATSEPKTPTFPDYTAGRDTVMTWTGPHLNDAGKRVINETLGERWYGALDYRKFLAHVTLIVGDTTEGRSFCAVRYGVSATPPSGHTARVPAQSGLGYIGLEKDGDCPLRIVRKAADTLRAGFQDMFTQFDMVTEAGQTYPKPEDIKKAVAKFDAELAAKPVASAPADRTVMSTTRSTNQLTCSNECYNGSCVRTFPDGRKERWQAPRRYNSMSQNWEYDTTTNACGG